MNANLPLIPKIENPSFKAAPVKEKNQFDFSGDDQEYNFASQMEKVQNKTHSSNDDIKNQSRDAKTSTNDQQKIDTAKTSDKKEINNQEKKQLDQKEENQNQNVKSQDQKKEADQTQNQESVKTNEETSQNQDNQKTTDELLETLNQLDLMVHAQEQQTITANQNTEIGANLVQSLNEKVTTDLNEEEVLVKDENLLLSKDQEKQAKDSHVSSFELLQKASENQTKNQGSDSTTNTKSDLMASQFKAIESSAAQKAPSKKTDAKVILDANQKANLDLDTKSFDLSSKMVLPTAKVEGFSSKEVLAPKLDQALNAIQTDNSTKAAQRTQKLASPILHTKNSVSENEIVQTVKDTLGEALVTKKNEIVIRLNPPELGRLGIRLQIQKQEVHVSFMLDNPQVKEIIDRNYYQLRQSLDQHGLTMGGLEVNVNDSGVWQDFFNEPEDNQELGFESAVDEKGGLSSASSQNLNPVSAYQNQSRLDHRV